MNKPSVCVDLDGVLAKYDGWKGVDHIGDPIPRAREFLELLSKNFHIIIHTTRVNPEVNTGHTYEELRAKVEAWLVKHEMVYDDIQSKPLAIAYIDDRACYCEPEIIPHTWNDAISFVGFKYITAK